MKGKILKLGGFVLPQNVTFDITYATVQAMYDVIEIGSPSHFNLFFILTSKVNE